MLEAAARAHPQAPFSFHAPPLRDGEWNRSTHVSSLIRNGFSISVDANLRGKSPRRLELASERQREYISQMVKDGILVKQDPVFSVPHFFLERGEKLRLIFDGRKLNGACKKPPRFNMKSHAAIAALSRGARWHAADDLSNMFFSIKLSEASRPFFGLKTVEGNYCYTALPFGFSWAPFMAHIAVDQIAQRAIEAGHAVTHYLDDFHYFGKSEEEVVAARAFVRKLFDQAGWVLNTKKAVEPNSRFEALGVEYDLELQSSRIPPASIASLVSHVASLNESRRITRRKLAAILGSLVFFGNAIQGSLVLCEDLIRIVARPHHDWGASFHLRDVKRYLVATLKDFQSLEWCPLQRGMESPLHIFTDATPTRIAFVWGERMEATDIKRKPIFRAEADAVHFLLAQEGLPKDFIIRTDNMALMHAMKKGRSPIPEAKKVCLDLLRLRMKGHRIAVKYIPTEENPADWPSRHAFMAASA